MTFEFTKYVATNYRFCDFETIQDGFLFVVEKRGVQVGKVITSRKKNLLLFGEALFRLNKKKFLTNEDNSKVIATILNTRFWSTDHCKLLLGESEYLFRTERPDVKFNLFSRGTWDNFKFSITGLNTIINYAFRLDFRAAPIGSSDEECPFTGTIEMEEKDLFLCLFGLFAVQVQVSESRQS